MSILRRSIQSVLVQTQHMLAGSSAGLNLVVKLRNQCDLTIGRAHGWGESLDPELNGEARWMRSVADRLQYVIDVGANKGDWTDLVLQTTTAKEVMLFDPSRSASTMLKSRFAGRPEVEVREAAVASAPGSMSFFEEEGAGETSSLVGGFSKNAVSRQVEITTIDAEVARRGWPNVDFLKIDAEGYDFHVLEGARGLFESGRISYGQFEYNSPWRLAGTTRTFAISWLRELGYECFLLKADGLHVPDLDLYREYYLYSNYAFIRKDLVDETLRRVNRR
jgi:FkbM family methyltransferase